MENNKVVYLHRKKTDNSVFYVGMGNMKRAYCKQRSAWWNRIVDKYGYIIEIYKDGLIKEDAFKIEINLIEKYGRIDLKNGQLINQTIGGITVEGLCDKVLRKRSKSLKSVVRNKEWNNKISNSLKGKAKTNIHKENLSKANLGKKHTEETKEKMRLSNKSKTITAKAISCYDYYSNEILFNFDSIRNAAKELGCKETSICNNLYNRSRSINSKTLNKKIKCIKI